MSTRNVDESSRGPNFESSTTLLVTLSFCSVGSPPSPKRIVIYGRPPLYQLLFLFTFLKLSVLVSTDVALETLLIVVLSPGIIKEAAHCVEGKYPCLLLDHASVTLRVEGVDVVSAELTEDGHAWRAEMILAWGIPFYVFNLKSSTKCRNFNWFLREKILRLKQENSVTDRVAQAVEDIEKCL